MADVTLQNVSIGLSVWRGRHWRRDRWRDDRRGRGEVIGFVDGGGVLRGSNADAGYYDTFWTVEEVSAESLTRPWRYGCPSEEGDVVTAGPGWAAVRWEETGKSAVYPIGAGGPLGEWWTKEPGVGYGPPCFSLSLAKMAP